MLLAFTQKQVTVITARYNSGVRTHQIQVDFWMTESSTTTVTGCNATLNHRDWPVERKDKVYVCCEFGVDDNPTRWPIRLVSSRGRRNKAYMSSIRFAAKLGLTCRRHSRSGLAVRAPIRRYGSLRKVPRIHNIM